MLRVTQALNILLGGELPIQKQIVEQRDPVIRTFLTHFAIGVQTNAVDRRYSDTQFALIALATIEIGIFGALFSEHDALFISVGFGILAGALVAIYGWVAFRPDGEPLSDFYEGLKKNRKSP